MKRAVSLVVALLLTATLAPVALAQAAGMAPPARSAIARREGTAITVGGRRTVLMWALGLSDSAEVEQYKQAGLNTVYLRISDTSAARLAGVSSLASAAEQAGLMVVFSLAPKPLRDSAGNEVALDPISDSYASAVRSFVEAAVEGVGEHPRLVAWAVELPPGDVVNNDAGFVSYLQGWYSSVADLNDSWGTEYEDWDEVALDSARDVDADLPEGIGYGSLDSAYYRQSAYADAVGAWAKAVAAVDAGRLIFAAGLPDYRSIISLPTSFDGIALSVYPSLVEGDRDTHNVHAVDIARRGRSFAAMQTLETTSDSTADELLAWAGIALAHGATGIAFSSWSTLRESEELAGVVEQIKGIIDRQAYPREPKPEAAILYEPFAGGASGRAGSLYGYIEGFAPGTPTNLFLAARGGSRYGLFDVLDWDAIAGNDLSQYGTIFAPMAFYLTTEAQVALQNYVLRGGALVVDPGVGMYQAKGTLISMPAIMREILGMRYEDLTNPEEREQEVDVGEVYDPANPTEPLPLAPGQEGKEFDPALTRFVQSLEQFLTRADVAEYLGDNFMGDMGEGFRVHGLGEGFAVYSTDFLYENWDSSDPFFGEFHDQVLSYNSGLEIIDPDETWPGVTATYYDDGSVGVASPWGEAVSVLLNGADNQVYFVPGGFTRLWNADEGDQAEVLLPGAPLARAAPLPIFVYPTEEGAEVSVSVERYDRDGIELYLTGGGADESVQDRAVAMTGGSPTEVEIEIKAGVYSLSADSVHTVTIQQGDRASAASSQEMMPDADTGSLVISATVTGTLVTIKPAAD